MPNVNAILANATLQVFDTSTSVIRVNTPLGNQILAATNATYYSDFTVTTTPTNVTLGNATVWAAFLRSWSTNTVNISAAIQPAGGSAATYLLLPGGIWMYWQQAESAGGITQVQLSVASSTAICEILLAW